MICYDSGNETVWFCELSDGMCTSGMYGWMPTRGVFDHLTAALSTVDLLGSPHRFANTSMD